MNETLTLLLLAIAGFALGVLFFGGLWLTVRKIGGKKNPTVWYFLSYVVRLGVVMTGFFFLTQGDWRRMLPIMAGFLIARFLVARFTKQYVTNPQVTTHEN